MFGDFKALSLALSQHLRPFGSREIEVPPPGPCPGGGSKYFTGAAHPSNFDLMTGFSLFPSKPFSAFGLFTALVGVRFSRFLFNPSAHGGPGSPKASSPSLRPILRLSAFQILTLGIIGEYVGRIYNEVA